MEITEVVIPDPEVVLERAHSHSHQNSQAKCYRFFNVLCRPKNFGRHCLSIQKKKIVICTLLSS
jgi:hypothetical protein